MYTYPFCRCYRRPSKRSIALWLYLYHGTGQLFHHEIGRAPLFCRLLLPLSDIPYIRHASKPQRTTQQKSKWLPFQFLFRRAKLDARFSPYPIFNPSIERKNRKKTFLRTFPDALFFPPSLFRPLSLFPYISRPLIFLRSLSIQGRRIRDGNMLFGRMINRHQDLWGRR